MDHGNHPKAPYSKRRSPRIITLIKELNQLLLLTRQGALKAAGQHFSLIDALFPLRSCEPGYVPYYRDKLVALVEKLSEFLPKGETVTPQMPWKGKKKAS